MEADKVCVRCKSQMSKWRFYLCGDCGSNLEYRKDIIKKVLFDMRLAVIESMMEDGHDGIHFSIKDCDFIDKVIVDIEWSEILYLASLEKSERDKIEKPEVIERINKQIKSIDKITESLIHLELLKL